MAKNGPAVIISFILLFTTGAVFILNKSIAASDAFQNASPEYGWLVHGLLNVLGYCSILLPGYLIYKYAHKINYFDKIGNSNGLFPYIMRHCFEEPEIIECTANTQQTVQGSFFHDTILLLYYFFGLQVSFLTWGVLQEKVMTQEYSNANGDVGRFRDSQFLVFVNRILAFCISGVVVLCTRQNRHKCPLYKYIFCSFSNIMSSWCQYEALKYVSFPHQVLAKASKTIPVMVMGKIVSRTKYENYEYITAVILSIGMLSFMLDTGNSSKGSHVTTFSGIVLLVLYIVFDSFTSNWQGALFKQFGMSPVQMMCGVNFFSCIFTAVSLFQQEGFTNSVNFMLLYPRFLFDCILLSVCSAAGQMFIFRTIATFGPLVFATISTIRQSFSVFLSCLIYQHHIDSVGIIGVTLVFSSIFLRIYCAYRIKTLRKRVQVTNRRLV